MRRPKARGCGGKAPNYEAVAPFVAQIFEHVIALAAGGAAEGFVGELRSHSGGAGSVAVTATDTATGTRMGTSRSWLQRDAWTAAMRWRTMLNQSFGAKLT